MTIRISEIYGPVSQGEGALLGVPMPFVRVAGCNLSCHWCDSKYTWEKGYAYTALSAAEVLGQVDALRGRGERWVSLTGGEPTLYADLGAVVEGLSVRECWAIVETNGLRAAPWLRASNVFISCSPKLPTSGQDSPARRAKVARFVQMVYARLAEGSVDDELPYGGAQFKFVIASAADLEALPAYCAAVGIDTSGYPTLPAIYVQPDGYVQPIERYLEQLVWLQRAAPVWARVTPQVHRLVHGPDARSV